ncbi:MAG: NAD(P)H-hydrate dehydratase [Flavobacteriales bacterium]|nr:NAD(P)H-hydrate dehydratase [Flavobacteriales bacterium]
MQPILTAAQVREADAYTIAHEPIKSLDLMERAGTAAFDWIYQHAPGILFPKHSQEAEWRFLVCAGKGNNGGDGLVVARSLLRSGYDVDVWIVEDQKVGTPDFEENLKRLKKAKGKVISISSPSDIPAIPAGVLVIDALFGTGLSRPLTGLFADLVQAINASGCTVVAIDVPSGLLSEACLDGKDVVVHATHTLTFQVPKLAFFFRENARAVGHWHVLPIGLDEEFIRGMGSPYALVEQDDLQRWLPPRDRFAHKGDHGHALLMAGSADKLGAALLATGGALRSGAGLVTTHLPASGLPALNARLPEAMASVDPGEGVLSELPKLDRYSAIGVGPGIGTAEQTAQVIKLLLQEAQCPLVIDADGLNVLAENPTWLAFLPANTALTPHPKELDRLVGGASDSATRLEKARELARKSGSYVVLKGAYSATCAPTGQVWFNPTGNPGMARGGSGDVLTGLLTGLLAQGLPPGTACTLAVYLHGLAGDQAAAELGMDGMTVTDLIDRLPSAWRALRG